MAVYTLQGPDGKTYKIEGPAGATAEQLGAVVSGQKAAPAAPAAPTGPAVDPDAPEPMGVLGNLRAGAIKGASQIGATLLTPIDAAARAMGVENDYIGRTDRRQASTAALQELGADPTSLAFQGGQLAAEIAGTAGVGGAVAAPLRGAAALAPRAAVPLNALAQAAATGGFRAGGLTGAAGIGTRVVGGAAAGGAAAGLVDPSTAGTGAVVGGTLPVAAQAVGRAGQAVGRAMSGPAVPQATQDAVTAARAAGYVIPPTQANPTLTNRLAEGFAGKVSTAQNASARNQEVSKALAARAVGLPDDVPITVESLNAVREEAGKAYAALAALPEVAPQPGSSVMNRAATDGFQPRVALEELKQARNDATAWYTAASRSASPDDLKKAKSFSSVATRLEKQFEDYAASIGRPDLVPAMQEARQLIAKTYTVEKALNPTTGSIDAKKLGAMITKQKPLTGELRDIGEFANRFPKAAQTIEGMGSLPQTSPLDWAAAGLGGAATGNPLMLAAVAARPAVRGAILSNTVQNRLVPSASGNRLSALLANDAVQQFGYRAAPVALSGD